MVKRRDSDESRRVPEDETFPDRGESELLMPPVNQPEAELEIEESLAQDESAQEESNITPPPAVPFRVFEQISGLKWDQIAGFKAHVKRQNLGPLSVPAWREALSAFMQTPVK